MRKSVLKKNACVILIVLSSILTVTVNTLAGGWGIERGRANAGDVARLLVDQLVLSRSQKRIAEAAIRPLAAERQRQLLGMSQESDADLYERLDKINEWWLKDVMGPADAIAGNPAASCAEANIAVTKLLGMMRERQLLGMSPEEGDSSPGAVNARAADQGLSQRLEASITILTQRCREEALDECIVTGRFQQIIDLEFGISSQNDNLGGGSEIDKAWVAQALKQCAIYELHFVSTTKALQIFNLVTVRDAKVPITFEKAPDLVIGEKLEDFLRGETSGGTNPFFVSVKCSQPGLSIVCMAGETASPFRASISAMDLKHREFYVDANGISKERLVGADKFSFELADGIYGVNAVVKVPGMSDVPIPMQAIGISFYVAHKKDRVEARPAVKIERKERGVYPVIFEFTYADQDSESNVSASDSTDFKLIHKPKPTPIERRTEPTRKPLKPSTRIKKIGG